MLKIKFLVHFPITVLRFSFALVVMTILLFSLITPAFAEEDPVWDSAESFLGLLDDGNFIQAWWEGGELLHLTSELDSWVKAQRMTRELMGELKGRTVKSTASRTSMMGFPDGDYRILVITSRFENKQKAYEVLFLTRDPYGPWKVVSYSLR